MVAAATTRWARRGAARSRAPSFGAHPPLTHPPQWTLGFAVAVVAVAAG